MWQHVQLSERIRPWDALTSCWGDKPPDAGLSYREQCKEGDEEADRGNDEKITSKSGLAKTLLQGTVQGGR